MPVEIRELQIITTVDDSSKSSSTQPKGSSGGCISDEVIAQCVEQVLEILREKNNR